PVASAARQGELEASAWVDDDHVAVGGMGDALGLYNFDQVDSLELIATLRQTGASATTYATAYCHSQAVADGRKGLRLLLSGGVDTYVMLSLCVSEERPRIPFPPEGAFFACEEVLNESKRWKEWRSDRRVVRMVDSAEVAAAAGEQCKREDENMVSDRGRGGLVRWRELESGAVSIAPSSGDFDSEAAPSARRSQGRVAAAKKQRTSNATGVHAKVVDTVPPGVDRAEPSTKEPKSSGEGVQPNGHKLEDIDPGSNGQQAAYLDELSRFEFEVPVFKDSLDDKHLMKIIELNQEYLMYFEASSKSHDDRNIQLRCSEVISAMVSLVKKALSARGPIWLLDALRPIGLGLDTRDYNDTAVFNCELMRRELLMNILRSLSAEDLLQYLDLTR
ncbi:hypothetical protein FOZ62_010771, partial [Perkinsus olseni]